MASPVEEVFTESVFKTPKHAKQGLLLVNLGTPDDATKPAIRRYLRDFLSDPRVIDLPWFLRYALLYGVILPFRTPKTTEAYQTIWSSKGSPLKLYTDSLCQKLSHTLGKEYVVHFGMRYGSPSIEQALQALQEEKVQHIQVLPLFPQYASATNGSVIEAFSKAISRYQHIPSFEILPAFYDHPGFIQSLVSSIQLSLNDSPVDHLLLSFHGLPERQLSKLEHNTCCDRVSACPRINLNNQSCYRAQCYETARLVAKELQVKPEDYSVSFQSRLGRIPWIQPYTDEHLKTLYQKGIRNLAVACPSFTSDCLETLEEIGLRAKEDWIAMGGKGFHLIPCVNDSDAWVNALASMVLS